jgi:hypothetical protein
LGKRKVLHLGVFDDRPKEHHTRYTLDAFPPLLGAEMYTYLYWSSHPDEPHPVLGRPPKRIHKNERSVAAIARHWRRIAGYAVHVEGMDADALTLAQLCEPAFAERFKEFILRRSGACTVNVTNLLTDLKTVARYWLQDDAAVKGLLRIFQELPRTQAVCEKEDRWLDLEDIDRIGQSRHPANPRRRELPPTHYQSWLFNHLDDPERYQPYPGWSFKIIAMWVGLSLMFRLWCHRPLRSRQISGLRLTDLIPQANGDYLMLIKGGDLKRARRGGRENRWEAHFPRRLLPLLEEWRERWRPRLLLTSPDQPHLFLNSRGHQWTEGVLRQLVERTTLEFTAERPGGPLAINPHQIRSLWATQMVIAGLNFADVCRLLGDTPKVVWDKYFLNQRKRPISQWTRDLAAAIGKGED